jgi:hypothetical protein
MNTAHELRWDPTTSGATSPFDPAVSHPSFFQRMDTRDRISIAIGAVMIALAAYVLAAPFWTGHAVTTARWLDAAFALFFAARGAMSIRRGMRRR